MLYVLATGEAHSVREFVECAFAQVGREIAWKGVALDEKGVDRRTGQILVEVDTRYFRPLEVHHLVGNPAKAPRKLGWRHQVTFPELVAEMVAADIVQVKRERRCDRTGLVTPE